MSHNLKKTTKERHKLPNSVPYSMQNSITFIWLFLFLLSSSLTHCFMDNFDESLESVLHDHAFRVMIHRRPHTGALYNATPPANLAGMTVSVVGLRSKTLWKKGANFSGFIIPPQTLPVPYVKRLLIVYHNLGNWSTSYYTLPGYSLITPVIGFLVYDASHLRSKNLSKIELNTNYKPIVIEFNNSTIVENQRTKCAVFGASGEVLLSEISSPSLCYSTSPGHFSLVVRSKKKNWKIWQFWIMGSLIGLVVLVLVGLIGAMALRSLVAKRSEVVEKEADEEENLHSYWVDSSKMPIAEVTRTQPVLENTILPNPKLSWYASG